MYCAKTSLHCNRWLGKIFAISLAIVAVLLLQFNPNLYAQSENVTSEGDPSPSIEPGDGTFLSIRASDAGALPDRTTLQKNFVLTKVSSLRVDKTFEGFGFDDNPTENINPSTGAGVRFIPPDPIGATGHSRVIAIVNSMIETRTKSGQLKWREGLRDFFALLSPTTFPFDPKIVYDQYEDRFVVVALEQITGTASVSPTNVSRILLAVSKDGNPQNAADWRFHAINSKIVIPRPVTLFDHWADYPGFEVDEEAIYITANMFTFVPFGSFGGVRLWIVDKGAGAGGFYDGGASGVTVHNPYASAGIATTTMPAQVFGNDGVGGAGSTLGTFLVSYSGLTFGGPGPEAVQVVTVDDPLGAGGGPFFTQEFVVVGNIEGPAFPALADAPQPGVDLGGIPRTIEVNDRRALDCVWRDNALWMVAEINPNSGPDAGQTTAHWWQLNTSAVPGAITLADQGDIGGEDIAAGTFTYFPSVAVNRDGYAAFGFSASAPTVFAGAYVTVKTTSDPPGAVQPSEVVKAGEDFYFRRFGGANNRWGDYSGIALDPSNEDFFWVFNEFADQRGSILTAFPTQDGRWGTAWGRCKFVGQNAKGAGDLITESIPSSFGLDQNYPNPFNPETKITYQLPEESHVVIKVLNLQGQLVSTLTQGLKPPGFYTLLWDGRNASGLLAPSGTYLYQIKAGDFEQTRKMVLLK